MQLGKSGLTTVRGNTKNDEFLLHYFTFSFILGGQGGGGERHYKNTLLVLSLFMNNAIAFNLGKEIDVCRKYG